MKIFISSIQMDSTAERMGTGTRDMIRKCLDTARHTRTLIDDLDRHKALEDEARQLKPDLRATEKRRDVLVAAAREKISQNEARSVLLERFHRILIETYDHYLRDHQRNCLRALENLHDKYAVTATDIENQRNATTAKFKQFLEELGYG